MGITTPQEVFAASKDRPFHLNEILIIEDEDLGSPKGEVIQTQSYNRFIPLEMDSSMKLEESFLSSLEEAGYDIRDDVIHIAKIRLLEQVSGPLQREPLFVYLNFRKLRNC